MNLNALSDTTVKNKYFTLLNDYGYFKTINIMTILYSK